MSEVSTGAWIVIDDCPVHYTVCQDEIEFEIGGKGSGAELIATEAGLVTLIGRSTEALAALRATGRNAN